jgi:hypothetical protein
LARRGASEEEASVAVGKFRNHRDSVFGPAEMNAVQHIIRDTHIKRGDGAFLP